MAYLVALELRWRDKELLRRPGKLKAKYYINKLRIMQTSIGFLAFYFRSKVTYYDLVVKRKERKRR